MMMIFLLVGSFVIALQRFETRKNAELRELRACAPSCETLERAAAGELQRVETHDANQFITVFRIPPFVSFACTRYRFDIWRTASPELGCEMLTVVVYERGMHTPWTIVFAGADLENAWLGVTGELFYTALELGRHQTAQLQLMRHHLVRLIRQQPDLV